ncbi:MAG: AbiEi antitoxin N-terminal domain-containing protein [Magnetococcus sp. DMHC-1]
MEHSDNTGNRYQELIDFGRLHGLIRPRDLIDLGFSRMAITRLARRGNLIRIGRGLYATPERKVSEHGTLAEVACQQPRVVVCLLSALRFHGLTTHLPFEVWLAIPNKARAPRMAYPPLRIVRFSGAALTEGIQEYLVDGVPVRITSVAKTVVDCFKYRHKIGLDVAIDALHESWKEKKFQMDDIWRLAAVCRVDHVMRPYVESLT